MAVTVDQLADAILSFFQKEGCCLFAGAGVGMHANLPSWQKYIEYLANVANNYEENTANLMRKRLSDGHYTIAAHLFKTCIEIPRHEMYKFLCRPFVDNPKYEPNNLYPLMALPFSAAVTTNYDRSLHDAYVYLYTVQKDSGLKLTAPQHVELGDRSMRQAIYWKNFFIARVHGRAEIPESIIIDTEDYRGLSFDDDYQDFLFHIVTRYHCLFIGFSFLDPAIQQVFELMDKKVPTPYAKRHLALLPGDVDPLLESKLRKYNIETICYDQENKHSALWEAIKLSQKELRTAPRKPPERVESVPGLGRFVASAYSRLKVGGPPEPLLEIVIEGVVAQTIIDNGHSGSDKKQLISSVKKIISLPDEQLDACVTRAIDGLSARGLCSYDGEKLFCVSGSENKFDAALKMLISGISNRLKVREGVDTDEASNEVIGKILNKLFLSRGWDLGAHFAGGRASDTFDAWKQIEHHIQYLTRDNIKNPSAYSNAIFDLFRHPEDKEAELLTDIGRVSFGIELAMNNSQAFASKSFILPRTVYLDSNVLMPAIVKGHPFSPVYTDAIKRMQLAAASTGNRVQLFVSSDFLEEIVSHRRLAIEQVQELGLEVYEKLKRYILFNGADGTNVFIGAYASWVGRAGKILSFNQFLSDIAPYTNNDGLSVYLEGQGVKTVAFTFTELGEGASYTKIRNELHTAYEEAANETFFRADQGKPGILIDHEAKQLTRLIVDNEKGRNPIFVSADKKLMSLCKGDVLGKCANSIVSHLGFIQMIDLVLGIDTDSRALSRLVWGIGYTEEETKIRNYLIDLALNAYDDAMARAMWEVIEEITQKSVEIAKNEKLNIFSNNVEEKARTAAFLDRVEEGFFANMSEVIKRRELQD